MTLGAWFLAWSRRGIVAAALASGACSIVDDTGTREPAPAASDAGAPPSDSPSDAADDTAGGTDRQPPASVLFSPATRRVVLEVDYAPGAEPYTGATGRLGSIWDIFRDNAAAIFDGKKEVVYPSTLAEMEQLDDVAGTRFGTADILAIAARHRSMPSGGDTVTFYVVFVDGLYVDAEGSEQPHILGVSVGTTGVIAMFKPTIAATASRGTTTPRFVEQSTLVHELGHAVGLVDLGVPATTAHVDSDHPHHCSSTSCVMYWANEGSKDAADFVQQFMDTGNRVMFGAECLEDIRALETTLE